LPITHGITIDDVGKRIPLLADRICLDTSIGTTAVVQKLLPIIRGVHPDQAGSLLTFGRIGRRYRLAEIAAGFPGYFFPYSTGNSVESYANDYAFDQDMMEANMKQRNPNAKRLAKPGDAIESNAMIGTILNLSLGFTSPQYVESFIPGIFECYMVDEWDEVEADQPIARIRVYGLDAIHKRSSGC
jgi:hypothetical protein